MVKDNSDSEKENRGFLNRRELKYMNGWMYACMCVRVCVYVCVCVCMCLCVYMCVPV